MKADNFKRLKEEFVYTADITVTDFITHFNNSLKANAGSNNPSAADAK
ncbi:MAG: hypothetical protein K4571_14385 [Deltaproteobacteria bacterium]